LSRSIGAPTSTNSISSEPLIGLPSGSPRKREAFFAERFRGVSS
jgi:hypothetical protein